MYIYAGKFSHVDGYANDDLWTVTFPDGIKAGNDAIVICQWTSTGDGKLRQNAEWRGRITRLDAQENETKIQLFKDDSTLYYWYVHRSACHPGIAVR